MNFCLGVGVVNERQVDSQISDQGVWLSGRTVFQCRSQEEEDFHVGVLSFR